MAAPAHTNELFFTDKQLCERWHCSLMKLWRLRKAGKLSKPIKIGGSGSNLTPASVVKALEADTDAVAA
jgi:hypothetical protein